MPRTYLQPTTFNKTTRKELELFQREVIVGRYLAGQKKATIKCAMGLPHSTIQTTIDKYAASSTGISAPCSRRSEILPEADKRYILLLVRGYSFTKIEDICKSLGNLVFTDTVAHMLKSSGYDH